MLVGRHAVAPGVTAVDGAGATMRQARMTTVYLSQAWEQRRNSATRRPGCASCVTSGTQQLLPAARWRTACAMRWTRSRQGRRSAAGSRKLPLRRMQKRRSSGRSRELNSAWLTAVSMPDTSMISARANSKVSALHASLDSTKAELDAALREAKSRGTDTSARDVRLQRALEEIARLKEAAKRRDERRGEDEGARRKELDALRGEVRKLERQKQELLTAFRKQLRLIDVLKRQKVHMEAARMLAFTEEEFARALEAGV